MDDGGWTSQNLEELYPRHQRLAQRRGSLTPPWLDLYNHPPKTLFVTTLASSQNVWGISAGSPPKTFFVTLYQKPMTGSHKPLHFWSITLYHNYTTRPSASRVKDIFSEFFDQWCFQLEKGTKEGKEHYQCRGIINPAQKTETLLTVIEARGYDRRDITFLPESNNSLAQGGLSFYVMKDDTRVEGPWYDPTYNPRKRVTYEGRDLECMKTPREFQTWIMAQCATVPDDRTMYWIFNQSGCGGKSKLMKYMRMNPEWDMARVPMGSATQIKTSVIEKGPHSIYMVDLPRVRGSDERQQELFSALEEIKNGWVESPMYGKNAELLMEPPHIFIFSNELPNLSFASMDRWRIFNLYDFKGTQAFRELSVQEVLEMGKPKD